MPIYEYYSPDTHTVYQFFARTLAQGRTIPRCPDNPSFRMERALSTFAVVKGGPRKGAAGGGEAGLSEAEGESGPGGGDPAEDARMGAAMDAMEREFAHVDENDPRAMGRMMRRMAELTGEKVDGEMEEVVRKLEEGADPESIEESLGEGGGEGADGDGDGSVGPGAAPGAGPDRGTAGRVRRLVRARRAAPRRDPKLYDYGDT